jgi:hypothetical protein
MDNTCDKRVSRNLHILQHHVHALKLVQLSLRERQHRITVTDEVRGLGVAAFRVGLIV